MAQNSDAENYFNSGLEYSKNGDYEKALPFFLRAYKLNKFDAVFVSAVAEAYIFNGDYNSSEKFFLEVINLDPALSNPYYNLACVYSMQSKEKLSLEYLEKSFYWGFLDYDHMMKDSDLDFIRYKKGFKSLAETYFNKKNIKRDKHLVKAEKSYKNSDIEAAEKYFRKFISLENKSDNPRESLILIAKRGIWNYLVEAEKSFNNDDIDEQISLNNQIIEHLDNLGIETSKLEYLYNLSYLYLQKKSKGAINNLLYANDILEEINDEASIAENNTYIAGYYGPFDFNEPIKAISFYKAAIDYYSTISDTAELIKIYQYASNSYIYISDFDNALDYINKAVDLSFARKDTINYYSSLYDLSQIFGSIGAEREKINIYDQIFQFIKLNPNKKILPLGSLTVMIMGYIKKTAGKFDDQVYIFNDLWLVYRQAYNSPLYAKDKISTIVYNWGEMMYQLFVAFGEEGPNDEEAKAIVYDYVKDNNLDIDLDAADDEGYMRAIFGSIITLMSDPLSEYKDESDAPCHKLFLTGIEIEYEGINSWELITGEFPDSSDYFIPKIKKLKEKVNYANQFINDCNNMNKNIEYNLRVGKAFNTYRSFDESEKYLFKALSFIDDILNTTPNNYKIPMFEQHLKIYQELASSFVKRKMIDKSLNVYEKIRLREMNKKLSLSINREENSNLNDDLELLRTNDYLNNKTILYYGIDYDYTPGGIEDFQLYIIQDDKIELLPGFNMISFSNDPLLKSRFIDKIIKDFDDQLDIKNIDELVKFYRYELTHQMNEQSDKQYLFSRMLYELLVGNFAHKIDFSKDIIIIPNHIFSFIPFESLIDSSGYYLFQKSNIQYIQSLKTLSLIKNQRKIKDPMVLALGGVIYNKDNFNGEIDYTLSNQSLDNLRNNYEVINTRGHLGDYYKQMFNQKFPNLPASYSEVLSIKNIFSNTDIISGELANEKTIKQLSVSGELNNYDIIHFATHAITINEFPELSAIVLSQNMDNKEDGFLNINEIAKLQISADYVNLSACETGLGNVSISGGVTNMAQAFFIAGAESVSMTLWPIADEGTSIFMESVYKNVNTGRSISKSLNMTKLEFIAGDYGEEYKKPYYWAPFVYYGK